MEVRKKELASSDARMWNPVIGATQVFMATVRKWKVDSAKEDQNET